MGYLPIEHYGIIGDMHTAALVGKNGSIDWLCFPSFDSPSIFAAILDDNKGGRFRIQPTCECTHKQLYFPETNILITRFLSSDGVAEIVDFMLPSGLVDDHKKRQRLFRLVRAIMGEVAVRMECHPAFNYARDAHEVKISPMGPRSTRPD